MCWHFPGGSAVKNLPMQEMWVQSLHREDALEEGTAPHSSALAWRIPWTEEPGRLQSMGLQRVRHNFQPPGLQEVGLCGLEAWAS